MEVRTKEDAHPAGERTTPTVTVYPDGPLILRGGVIVQDLAGEVLSTGRVVALCRCGRSALKPFCDGSHKRSASHPDVNVRSPQGALPLGPVAEHVIGEPRIDV